MEFTSAQFLLFATTTVLVYRVNERRSYRISALSIANAVFIGSYLSDLREAAPLAAYLVLAYLGIELVRRVRSRLILAITLCLTISLFIFLKQYSFLPDIFSLPSSYLTLGLSYILFRVLHLIIDAHDGEIPERIAPLVFLNYTCNFLCLVSGPIQLYHDYLNSFRNLTCHLGDTNVFLAIRVSFQAT
jgi:alginate O-acetyltransferase complex protein AlgI